jgi:ligand-binding sensor domain-containing protein/two-component sensor histidine kinase
VWIGTTNGLNRYDSKNIKVYHHNPNDSFSLPRETIISIVEDKNGILWIGSDYGLIEFNPVSEKFKLHLHQPGNPNSLSDDHVPNPFIDSKNNLWVGTGEGLQLFDWKHKTFETFLATHPDSMNINPSLGWTGNIVEDKEHNIWLTGNNEILKFDAIRRSLKLFPYQNNPFSWIVNCFIDHDGNFWLGHLSGGLTLFHPGNGQFEPINNIIFDRVNEYQNFTEWRDPMGIYWLAISSGKGLLLYNHSAKKTILVPTDAPAYLNSLLETSTTYIYVDNENMLWIGTNKGLRILDNADQIFHIKTISQGTSLKDSWKNVPIFTIYEEPNLKMATFLWSNGLGIYTKDWQPIRFYSHIPPSDTSQEARNIFGIYKDFRGIYWISTDNGIIRFDIAKDQFKVYMPPNNEVKLTKGPWLMREIIPFDSTSFYVRSRTWGIFKFDFIKEQFVEQLSHNDKDPTSLPSNYLRAFIKDDENRLIIISVKEGIFIYNPQNYTYETYNHHPDASINEAIHNLYFDPGLSNNILWLNSAHGLIKFDLQTKQFELFNSKNGLANEFLISNEVDINGNIWVAHNAGISRFDKATRTFTNYNESNGLVFREFESNMRKTSDDNICIGDQDLLIYFNPDQLKANQNIPQVHINSVQVLNEPCNMTIDSITHKKSLKLTFDQELITVDFSVLNFTHPNENRFFFRLDKDTIWQQVNEGSVNLVRLSPGHYVLHVTGSNDSGLMNPTGDSLYINILPPYYQTWWFRILLAIGLLLIFFVIRRRGINRIKRDEQLKTEFNKQLAQAETKALRSQMNPHFIFNSLNSINSFVMDQKHELASDYLIKFSKLIRLILDNSRSETITIEKELETLKLYVILESARYDNKFKCVYNIAEDINTNSIMIPPMLMQPFVENAIWHGLMQKEGEGTITIEIRKEDEEFLNISITDDGIGREKAAELKSKSATHKSHGLKVTSQRIEMMNKLNSTGAKVHIIDLKDEKGIAFGTKVELMIPY